jgi:hypothetical protein
VQEDIKTQEAIVRQQLKQVSGDFEQTQPAEVNQAAPLTRKEFADALGCSKGHISYLWSEGMPNSSIAAAKAWRLDQKGNLFFLSSSSSSTHCLIQTVNVLPALLPQPLPQRCKKVTVGPYLNICGKRPTAK